MLTERMKLILKNGKSVSLNRDKTLYLSYYNGRYYMVNTNSGELSEMEVHEAVALAYKSPKFEECQKAFSFSKKDIDSVADAWGGRW